MLDSAANKLVRKLEVRYKRSRKRDEPAKTTGAGRGLQADERSYCDVDDKFFNEPTTELYLVDQLINGWFAVLLPTSEHEKYRWHIFAFNSLSKKIKLTTLRCSADSLFELTDDIVLEGDPTNPTPRTIPGVIRRTLTLKDSNNSELTPIDDQPTTQQLHEQSREIFLPPNLLSHVVAHVGEKVEAPAQPQRAALTFDRWP